MSTPFLLHKDEHREVEILDSSSGFSLDLYGYPQDCSEHGIAAVYGPQRMAACEALQIAASIIYAVWCSYPAEAEAKVAELMADIPAGARRA